MSPMRPFVPVALAAVALMSAPSVRFEPMQQELFATGGALVNTWADYDNDGDPDLYVGFNGTPNRLYRNNKSVFADVAVASGLAEARGVRAAAWGDYDGDGDADLIVGFAPGDTSVLKLLQNDAGHFVDVTAGTGVNVAAGAVRQLSWIDIDGDDDLDLFVAFRDKPNALFRNDDGHFTDVAATIGLADPRKSVGAVWFDADEDGDLDLYVANMDGDANGLFQNDAGQFTDVADAAGLAWGGRAPKDPANGTVRPCIADVNNDGHIDVLTANYGRNGLFLNDGRGHFRDGSADWGVDTDSHFDTCAFADVNNDGHPDFYVNGTITGGVQYRDYLFVNTGDRFEDATPENVEALASDHGASWADVDGDGAIDLSLAGSQANGMHAILRNMLTPAEARRSISVRVVGPRGRATRAGAEVRVYAAGSRRLIGSALVDSGSGYNMQNDLPVHIGTGTVSRVDIEVTWPSGGHRAVTRTTGIRRGARVTIKAQ